MRKVTNTTHAEYNVIIRMLNAKKVGIAMNTVKRGMIDVSEVARVCTQIID